MTIGPCISALLTLDLAPAELAAEIKAILPAADAANLERLISIAPPAKLQALLTTYAAEIVKAEKAEAKRVYNRDRNRALRPATRTTSTTPERESN